MSEVQLARVEGLLEIVPPDHFVNRNAHEWVVLGRTSVIDVLGPAP